MPMSVEPINLRLVGNQIRVVVNGRPVLIPLTVRVAAADLTVEDIDAGNNQKAVRVVHRERPEFGLEQNYQPGSAFLGREQAVEIARAAIERDINVVEHEKDCGQIEVEGEAKDWFGDAWKKALAGAKSPMRITPEVKLPEPTMNIMELIDYAAKRFAEELAAVLGQAIARDPRTRRSWFGGGQR